MPETIAPDRVYKSRSRRAIAVKKHGADSPEAREAKRDLAAAKLERDIARAIAEAPPLTDEQAHRIAALLLVGGDAA